LRGPERLAAASGQRCSLARRYAPTAIRAAAAASGAIYAVPMRQRSATFELEGPAAPQMAQGTSGTRGLPW
jgi:hypothetical protein